MKIMASTIQFQEMLRTYLPGTHWCCLPPQKNGKTVDSWCPSTCYFNGKQVKNNIIYHIFIYIYTYVHLYNLMISDVGMWSWLQFQVLDPIFGKRTTWYHITNQRASILHFLICCACQELKLASEKRHHPDQRPSLFRHGTNWAHAPSCQNLHQGASPSVKSVNGTFPIGAGHGKFILIFW